MKKASSLGRFKKGHKNNVKGFNEHVIVNSEVHILIKNKKVIVDIEDLKLIENNRWYLDRNGYVSSTSKTRVQLSRMLLNCPDGMLVDHISGNVLDNRRCNLRIVDKRKNAWNMKPNSNTSSKYKGVCWDASRSKWRANIKLNGKQTFLGRFLTEDEAAITYNEAAKIHFGEYARLNIIKELA